MITKEQLDLERIPQHIALIMDGNGRWARKRGNPRVFGHKNGVTAVRDTLEGAVEIGLKYLTLYAFSTENWRRPQTEIDALMSLLVSTINRETETLIKNNVKLSAIGDMKSLPQKVAKNLMEAIKKTESNTGLTLILALSYSSRWEIVESVKKIAKEVLDGKVSIDEIDNDYFSNCLTTHNIPDPELLIRTSGENRISNFLLWQIAYSELYFTTVLWPDFRRGHLYEAIADYQSRERRFGKTSEQLSENLNANS